MLLSGSSWKQPTPVTAASTPPRLCFLTTTYNTYLSIWPSRHPRIDLCILRVASIYTCALTCTHTCAHACTCSPIILGLQLTIEHLCNLPLPKWMQRHAEAHGLASGTRASSRCPLTPNQGPTFKTMTPYTPTKLVLFCN